MSDLPRILRGGIIQPKYILAIVTILMAIMIGIGLYELSASKQDVMSVLQEEALSLAEAVSIMGDNSLMAFDSIEELAIQRLMDNARILEHLDHGNQLSEDTIKEVTEKNDIRGIDVFAENGVKVLGSEMQKVEYPIAEFIEPLLNGTQDEMVIKLDEDGEEFRAVGIRRRKGGAIVLGMHSSEMLDLRKSIGIGNLIQEIGENDGIDYIVLQDEVGLILASRNVERMRRIAGDEFLENTLQDKLLKTRIYAFNGKEVLEVVSPFQIDETTYGLFRIGLSMKEVRAVETRSKQRLIFAVFVALVVGIISLSLILMSQNYSLLRNAYEGIQTYTGMVLENIADGIIVSDKKGVISVFNKAAERIFSKKERDAIGASVAELGPEFKKRMDNAINGPSIDSDSEITIRTPNTGNQVLSIRTSGIAETEGNGNSIVVIVRDITETRLIEENMRRTEQLTAMGKLASAVAHEVRNPLNAISMIAQRLSREFVPKSDKEQYDELVSMVRSESARINGIVEDFLQFARPPRLNLQEVDMDQLLHEIVLLIESQALKNNIEIVEEHSNLGIHVVDREQMKQALLNLLLNGIEAMPDGGILSIRGRMDEGELYLEISDTGDGIPEEEIHRIFDLYFTTKDAGTGLGLSIVQRVAVEHGGRVGVDSRQGNGTTFTIYLPDGG